MRSKIFILAISLVILAGLGLTGCGDGGGNNQAGDEKKPAADSQADQIETEKWNAYVALSGKSDSLMKMFSEYENRLGNGPEPVLNDKDLAYFVKRIGESRRMMDQSTSALTAAAISQAEKKPQSDLDLKALAFARSVNQTWAKMAEIQGYYEAKSHVDDGLAKGREMHAGILADYQTLAAAYLVFSEAMDQQNRLIMAKETKSMRDGGLKILPAALDMLIAARDFNDEIGRQLAALNEEAPPVLEAAPLQALYERLVKGLAAIEAVEADQAQRQKEGLFDDRVARVVDYCRQIKGAATDVMAEANKGESSDSGLNAKVLDEYNRKLDLFIGAYNRMIETRRTK